MPSLRFLVTLLLISLFLSSQAQNNYSSGWVVLNSGDTLKGAVLNKDWTANPKEIKFKKDNIITYTISDLKAFGINGESIYQRHTVKYHLLSNDESAQYAPNEELIDSASVWLKLLVSSKIYFEAPSLKRFFFYNPKCAYIFLG